MHHPLTRRPPLLAPGARVALVAPAGPLAGEDDLARAVSNARALGWEPVVGAHVLGRDGYLAGDDATRARDLNKAITDATVDGIWCLRGGYGAMRILEAVDYDALARRPKAVIGYSDITALHAAVRARCGLVTFHGPTARAALTAFSRDSLERAVARGQDPCGAAPAARVLREGRARGRLAGGNLALVAALAGTPYAALPERCILVLEDVNEAVYRIDRMLTQLRLAGILSRCSGIVFGHFTEIPAGDPASDGVRPIETLLNEVATEVGVPCVAGAPVGHVADQWTLPLGAMAELDADAGTLGVPPIEAV
ncbi:MAG TPA: LD-carboxypeptidase [Gemmatimonadaceae bacterium]|nr:LD-carboxypeptidase [Gemmatimonadaceae bacterium]